VRGKFELKDISASCSKESRVIIILLRTAVRNRLSPTDPIDLIFSCATMGLKPPVELKREIAPSAIWVGAGSVFRN